LDWKKKRALGAYGVPNFPVFATTLTLGIGNASAITIGYTKS